MHWVNWLTDPVSDAFRRLRMPEKMPDQFTWQRWAMAAAGIIAMIAGGFLQHTPAGGPLVASGSALVGFTIPWPSRKHRAGDNSEPPPSLR